PISAVTLEPEPVHAGGVTGPLLANHPASTAPDPEETRMTVQTKPSSVTTGPIAGSRKIYTSPEGRPEIRVPFREIALDPSARETPFRAYDTSGLYTDATAGIDL